MLSGHSKSTYALDEYPRKHMKTYKRGGGSAKTERTLEQFSQGKYLQGILNKLHCLLNIIHARSHSQSFFHKYVVIFRGITDISHAANFELTEINNTFKCSGYFIN